MKEYKTLGEAAVVRLGKFMNQSDEEFVKKLLSNASEEEKDEYFREFPEYEKYRKEK